MTEGRKGGWGGGGSAAGEEEDEQRSSVLKEEGSACDKQSLTSPLASRLLPGTVCCSWSLRRR